MRQRIVGLHQLGMLLGGVLLALVAGSAVRAQSVLESSSLEFVPADVSVYGSMQRNREQFDLFVNSKAFAKIKSLPFVQMGMGMLQQQPQWEQFQAATQDPQAKMGIDLLVDALSHEIFMYAGDKLGPMVVTANLVQTRMNEARLKAAAENLDEDQVMMEAMLKTLDELPEDGFIADLVIGFKLSDTQPAQQFLAQLEAMSGFLTQQQPMFQGRVNRKNLGGGDFLVLNVDGSMIPWEEGKQNFPGTDAQWDKLVAKIKPMTLMVAVGVRDDYLMISIGENEDQLTNLGQGSLLAKAKELAPLKAHANKPITGVSYVSSEFAKQAGNVEQQMKGLVDTVRQVLTLAPMPEALKSEIVADAETLAGKIASSVPTPGAQMGFSFMTPTGYEGYSYNWGESVLDGSKPLTILDHVGGAPLMYVAARGKHDPQDYDDLTWLLKRGLYYAEAVGMQELGDREQELVKKLKAEFAPLGERLDKTTRENMVPAFADGQGALVIDGKTKSQSWHAFLPVADQPLPMLEVGFVYGVSDADKVKAAFSDYFQIAQEALDKLHTLSTSEEYSDMFANPVPPIQIPTPLTKEDAGGTIYFYSLPPQTGVDPQLAPNAALSDDTMVMSLIPKFTSRLLNRNSLQVGAAEAKQGKSLAAASYCDFAGFVDVLLPWVDYGASMSLQVNSQPGGPDMSMVIQHVKDVAEVLKCFKGGSSATYKDGDAWVTHGVSVFQDLK